MIAQLNALQSRDPPGVNERIIAESLIERRDSSKFRVTPGSPAIRKVTPTESRVGIGLDAAVLH